jgi:chromate transporter
MNTAHQVILMAQDWFNLLLHFLSLSLMMFGGALTVAPDLHRYLVEQQHWLTDAQFTASIAIAQSSPGPNVLYVALIGWNVGMNAGGTPSALLGMVIGMFGILLPSSLLTYNAGRWLHARRDRLAVRVFKQGMVPVVIGLFFAAGWIMAMSGNHGGMPWPLWLLTAVTTLLAWRSKLHLLILLGVGAVLGGFGLV